MSRLVVAAVALALSLLGSLFCNDAALAERRVALVIGNSAYQHVPALRNPAKNAQAVAAMLQKAGFDVVDSQYDAGDQQLKRSIRQFEDAAADADIAIVYYAGLGIGIGGANYLVPVDAKLVNDRDADGEAVSLQRLADAVGKAKRLRLSSSTPVATIRLRGRSSSRPARPGRSAPPWTRPIRNPTR